jgi:DNA-binding XRE family transcriptional regulator
MNANLSYDEVYFLQNLDYLISISTQFASKRAVANAIGISSVAFTNMAKRGSLPSVEVAAKCAELFGISIDEIIYDNLKNRQQKPKIALPVYSLKSLKEPLYILNTSLDSKYSDFGILITNDDSSLYSGDIFVISKDYNINNYDYVLINDHKNLYIKQIKFSDTKIFLINLSLDEVAEKSDQIEIIGVVTQKIIPTA